MIWTLTDLRNFLSRANFVARWKTAMRPEPDNSFRLERAPSTNEIIWPIGVATYPAKSAEEWSESVPNLSFEYRDRDLTNFGDVR